MTNIRFLTIISIYTLLTLISGQHQIHASETDDIAKTENLIFQQQKKAKRLEQGIEEQTKNIIKTKKKEGNILTELDTIDERLQEENRQLYTLKSLLTEKELALHDSELEVLKLDEQKKLHQDPVKERLIAYYRVGDIGIMNLLFSASSLPDLINFKEYFHRVVLHDQEIIEGYRQAINKLHLANADRQDKNILLTKTIDDISAQQKKLALTRAERVDLLKRVKTEKKLYNRAVEEMRAAADELANTIKKLKKDASPQPQKPQKEYPDLQSPKKRRPQGANLAELTGFAAKRGLLPPPTTGIITTSFGRNITEKFGITTFQNGIDFSTTPGTEVHAIYEGTVAFAGVLRGYGNMVIIDHGGQYYSLSSQISKLHTEEGATVKEGDTIGIMGDTKGLLVEGLHFEIRYGTIPQDPLAWLDGSKIKLKKSKATP